MLGLLFKEKRIRFKVQLPLTHDLGEVQGHVTLSGLGFLICLLRGTEQGSDFSTWEGKMMPEIKRYMPQTPPSKVLMCSHYY